jgi:DNA modification methylase
LKNDIQRQIGIERHEEKGEFFTAVNNDCVLEMFDMESDSVGLHMTSIPFGTQYEYSLQFEDFGHNPSNDEFWEQMDFLIPEMYRTLKPGRVAAIHVKDRVLYGHQTPSGFMEIAPFSDECVMAFRKHGFMYEGRRTIMTDVVKENNQTYRLGWTEMTNDASKMGSGMPEYLLLFRKPPSDKVNARADEPVTKSKDIYTRGRWQVDAHSFWKSSGNRLLEPLEYVSMNPKDAMSMWRMEQQHTVYDHERHVAICEAMDKSGRLSASYMMLPPRITKSIDDMVWDDIVYMRTLNSEQSRGREEAHLCPLPLEIVERAIRLYSNEGDLVVDPFSGLFTTVYLAVKMGRRGYGIEINDTYFYFGTKYCNNAEQERMTPTLFAYLEQVSARAQEVEAT